MIAPSTNIYHEVQTSYTKSTCKCMSLTTSARAVSFSPDVLVKRTLHINDFSDNEVKATWYDEVDYERMQEEISLTIAAMEACNGNIEDEKCCTRGLELQTRKGTMKKRRNRKDAINAVLDEQDLQCHEKVNKPEIICTVYHEACYLSCIAAHRVGLEDANVSCGLLR